ncbi:hypothetical protein AAC387_Pa04g2905 [Persea americana]
MADTAASPTPPSSPSSPSPPKKPKLLLPPPPPAPPPAPTVPASWSHSETMHLIDAYQEKWYSLNRGQLKAHQWEEVAASVAALSASHPPTKTATQCRHKIEKLRKRYRADKLRPSSSSSSSPWPFFHRMDLLERGPTSDPPRTSATTTDDDDDDDPPAAGPGNNTRSINHILRRPQPPSMLSPLDRSFPRCSRSPRFWKRSSFEPVDEEEDEEEEEDPMSELAAVVRSFGEGLVRVEKMKMEMMREAERNRMEMEMKRTEMIMKSQQRIADAIADAFRSRKKAKNSQELSTN